MPGRRLSVPDREATANKACALVKQAAAGGAQLVAFPEAFIPTYPDWVWRTTSWADGRYVRELYANAVEVPGPVDIEAREAERAKELTGQGHLLRLWKLPDQPSALGLWNARIRPRCGRS